MALYCYVKEQKTLKKKIVHKMSYFSLTGGALLLFWSFYPIFSFEIYSRLFIQNNVSSPIPQTKIGAPLQTAGAVLGSTEMYSSNIRDFVHANLWFPAKPQPTETQKVPVTEYTLSIPKLNIVDAKVLVGGEDLSKSLVHYIPITMPGENGNVSIFGHSTLPQLYNVKDYKSIFTYLPSLEKGDIITVKLQEKVLEYEIFDMFVVKPENISVLDQRYDGSYLTVITCVPPGTYWNRLVVKAKLTTIGDSL